MTAPGFLSLVVHAEMTITVKTAIAASANEDDRRLGAAVPPLRPRGRAPSLRPPDVMVLTCDEARVELVDVELPVEAEVLRIRAQEALDVRLGGQQLELVVLERAQVLAADLGRGLGFREVDPAAHASLAQAVPDLEHGPLRVAVLLRGDQNAVDAERERAGDADVEAGPGRWPGAHRPAVSAVDAARRGQAGTSGGEEREQPEHGGDGCADIERLKQADAREPLRGGDGRRHGEHGQRAEERRGAARAGSTA